MMSMFKSRNSEPARVDHRIAGDAARDVKNWRGAITAYEAHLADVTDDAGIWVQLGNCSKEAGDFERSEAAYKQALTIAPNIADTHLQLGHLYKVMRRWPLALSQYRRARELNPLLADAAHEIIAVERLIQDLPFQLPQNYLDLRQISDIDTLIAFSDEAPIEQDPFKIFAKIIEE